MESGNSVLRHGWFQPGYDTWAFETLDAGVSIGSGVATVVFGDQHHVFNAGTDTGQSALRHGWFDPTVGTWQFETVDFGKSDSTSPGSGVIYDDQLHVFASAPTGDVFPGRELRHGRRDSVSGIWAFETLDPYEENSGCENSGLGSAIVGSDGNLNWFGERLCNNILGIPNQIPELRHAWYDAAGWHYETLNRYDDSPSIPSTSSFHGNSEVFGRSAELFPCGHHGGCLGHMWWDGAWHVDYPDLDTAGVNPVSTSTYPTFDQLHAFFAGGSGLRHVWYQPT
ncbi:MAG: hypothetical protein DCC49_07620 [Acidobacteria bacterium]|nr:MAG: hypothetical protein DCC49_07620 [Acidobacteriota bacterium]